MRFRYPGPDSFGDSPFDARMFFGRQEEIQDLANLVTGVRLMVLYGKSGLGKTSLLQAGLFPRLRRQYFLPIRVRPSEIEGSLVESVARHITESCGQHGYQLTASAGDSLYELFSQTLISRGERFLVPVLVFDQFEEVFNRLDREARQALIREVQTLLYPPPGRERAPDVRVLLSLREEYVGALDEFAEMLPGVLAHRYRLRPLNREQARDAIELPAKQPEGEGASPSYGFADGSVDQMLDYLQDAQRHVEPIELQILCQHIERGVIERHEKSRRIQPVTLQAYFPKGMQAALEDFYLATVNSFTGATRKRVRRFCEQGLVTLDGYRDSVRGRRIKNLYGLDDETLNRLVDKRLLRREDRLNDVWYELTHDRLAEAVAASRPEARLTGILLRGRVLVEGLMVAIVCALVLAGFRYSLALNRDPVIASIYFLQSEIARMADVAIPAIAAGTVCVDAPGKVNFNAFLEPELANGLVEIVSRDCVDVLIVRAMFDSGSASVTDELTNVLLRIGEGLDQTNGRISVSAHTDGRRGGGRSLQFPSVMELTQARAEAVKEVLEQVVSGTGRIEAVGRGDRFPICETCDNLRVEIEVAYNPGGAD
jgi:flagellar motor protein MotB